MNKGIISLLCLLFLEIVIGQPLTIYGVNNPSISKGVLKATAEGTDVPIILEFTNITTSAFDSSSVNYFEGKLFDKPTKATWFQKDNTKASLKEMDKAVILDTSDHLTFAIYIDSRKTWPSNVVNLVYNYTVFTAGKVFKTLRYEIPYKKTIEITLPPEITHLSTVVVGKKTLSATKITEYKRRIEGSGAHREVITTMQISADKSLDKCKLFTIEPVLEYHFIEIDFLDEITGCKYWINKNCNIELPSGHALQYLLVFHFENLTTTNEFYSAVKTDKKYRVEYKFPYHFRYQPAGVNEYENVEVLNPLVYLSCNKEHTNVGIEEMILKHVIKDDKAVNLRYAQPPEIWKDKVPTGLLKDKAIVGPLTLAIAILAVLAIIYVANGKVISE